jgi:hypothetical protein
MTMIRDPVTEARDFAPYSLRLRLMLAILDRNPVGFVRPDFMDQLARLVEAVRQQLGCGDVPGSSWSVARRPYGHWEGEAFLRQSAFIRTPHHEQLIFDGLATAGPRLSGDPLVSFVRELMSRAEARGVPLYPAHMGLDGVDVDGLEPGYVCGLGLGNCVQMAAPGIEIWPRASLEWLDHHARAAADSSRVGRGLMIWRRWPGFYQLIDDDGCPLGSIVGQPSGEVFDGPEWR